MNNIFKCNDEDRPISQNNRKNKSSYHLILTNQKTTIKDMLKFRDRFAEEYKKFKIDTSVYRNGWSKFRTVHSKKEIYEKSQGLKPNK